MRRRVSVLAVEVSRARLAPWVRKIWDLRDIQTRSAENVSPHSLTRRSFIAPPSPFLSLKVFDSYLAYKRVRSKCLTSILPQLPTILRLLASSDGVADCGYSLERRWNAGGVEHGRKTKVSKLRKR